MPSHGEKVATAPERRAKRERRMPRPPAEGRDALLEQLAKLLGVLSGVFVGLFIAYFISALFIAPFNDLVDGRLAERTEVDKQTSDLTPEFEKADRQYKKLRNQWETAIKQQLGNRGPVSIDGAPPTLAPSNPAGFSAADQQALDAAEATFRKVDNQMKQLTSRDASLKQEVADYQRSILILNLLSGAVVLIMGLLGYLFYPLLHSWLRKSTAQWGELFAQRSLRTGPLLIGFFGGLILAVIVLLGVFTTISAEYTFLSLPPFRLAFGAFTTVVFGIVGALVGASYFTPPPAEADPYLELRRPAPPMILDSSVLIDGRVHEVVVNGFLQGILVVPESVLKELQFLADSSDERRRLRGRRGLDLVNKLKGDTRLELAVFDDSDFDRQGRGTDEHLILVAKAMKGWVVTNDYNLNRVASARDVRVININALANAVKTNLLPGDFVDLDIVDRGKQRGQGVGYLADGTMVVVEDGEPYIGMVKTVKLTSISQTQAGRLLFGRVDLAEGRNGADNHGGSHGNGNGNGHGQGNGNNHQDNHGGGGR